MARLVNLKTNAIGEVDDDKVYDYLKSERYGFADEETPIHVTDKEDVEGLGRASYMNREDAKRYILQSAGTYMNAKQVSDYTKRKSYGSREGTAAALGVAGALTVGIAPAIAGLVSDDAAGIMEANPGWMLGSDIMTTIAALALAPATGGTTAAAGTPTMMRLLAKSPLGKKGAESLLKYARKLTAAPVLVDKFGKGQQAKMGMKLLGEAAEEQLKKAGARGLASRMYGMGAEAMVYSAGYSLHDVVKDYKKDRSWDEIAGNYLWNVGMGTTLGVAIPGVFMGAPIVGAKLLSTGKKIASMPVNWAFDSKIMDSVLDGIAKGHDNMHVETKFGEAADKINIKQTVQELKNREGAHKQAKMFAKRIEPMVKETTSWMGQAIKLQQTIKKIAQFGHSPATIKTAVGAIEEGRQGAASSGLLAERLINGNFSVNDTQVSGGFLDVLRSETLGFLQRGSKQVEVGDEWHQLTQQGEHELRGILKDIDSIQNTVHKYVRRNYGSLDRAKKKVKSSGLANKKFQDLLDRSPQYDIPGMTEEMQIVAMWNSVSDVKKILNEDFNAGIFHKLEQLSARIHRTIPHGPIKPDLHSEEWADKMKGHLTDFLTESSDVWSRDNQFFSMFGKMNQYKRKFNAMMVARQSQHDEVLKRFSIPLEKFPKVPQISEAKVEGVLRTLGHEGGEASLKFFEEYVGANNVLLGWMSKNFWFKEGKKSPLSKEAHAAWAASGRVKNRIGQTHPYLKRNMKKAMEWSAILDAEAKQAQAVPNRGLLPYLGTGALASGIGWGVAGPVGGAIAGAASVAGRYGYDMMANPARALANMQKFFAASDAFDDIVSSQVERYFVWLNQGRSKYTKKMAKADRAKQAVSLEDQADIDFSTIGRARLMYDGPGSEATGRYPAVLGSRFIAQYVTGEEE